MNLQKNKSAKSGYKKAITWIVIAFVVKLSGTYIANGSGAAGRDISSVNEAARLMTMTDIIASLMAIIGLILLLKAGYDKRKNRTV